MRLDSLIHLTRAVLAMAEVERVIVFGSASLLGKHPQLGEQADSPLRSTYDADLIPIPFEEEIGLMLDEAFGEDRVFHQRFGYHADIVRPKVTETFPLGWEDRLSALPGVDGAFCLDPHDMAAAKCLIGREKDGVQLRFLIGAGILDPSLRHKRLDTLLLPEDTIAAGIRFLDELQA